MSVATSPIASQGFLEESEEETFDLGLTFSAIVYSTIPAYLAEFSDYAGEITDITGGNITIAGNIQTVPTGYDIEVTVGQTVEIDTLLASKQVSGYTKNVSSPL